MAITVKRNEKAKSCKGALYYSSALQSKAKSPRCLGISRTHPQGYTVTKESDVEEKQHYKDFKFVCAGISAYRDQIGKESSAGDNTTPTELPDCSGIKYMRFTTPAVAPTPAHAHTNEDAHEVHQPQRPKPIQPTGSDFLTRFSRNADVVAAGVWKNMRKVGNYVKASVSDILYPYRGRPK